MYICFMDAARAIRVYEGVKDLMNKEQKGFVTPRVFNSFAQIAQLNVFHEMFDDVIDGRKLRAQGVDGSDGLSMYNEAVENLAFFKKDRTVSMSSGKAALPGDMYKLIGIRKESSNVLERVPFEIVRNNNDAAYILGSNLSTPTAAFPVAIVTDSIELFPTSITKAIVSYYRLPGCVLDSGVFDDRAPFIAAKIEGSVNEGIVQPTGHRNFMIPRAYESELVYEMAKLIGVRLEDQGVASFAAQEEANR